jgi:hypothetical protein
MNMKAKPKLKQSMQEEQIRSAINTPEHASAVDDAETEQDIYHDDAVCDYPRRASESSGSNLQATGP